MTRAIDIAQNAKGDDPFGYRTEFVQLLREAKTAAAMQPLEQPGREPEAGAATRRSASAAVPGRACVAAYGARVPAGRAECPMPHARTLPPPDGRTYCRVRIDRDVEASPAADRSGGQLFVRLAISAPRRTARRRVKIGPPSNTALAKPQRRQALIPLQSPHHRAPAGRAQRPSGSRMSEASTQIAVMMRELPRAALSRRVARIRPAGVTTPSNTADQHVPSTPHDDVAIAPDRT